jgi:chromosome partitioning protein
MTGSPFTASAATATAVQKGSTASPFHSRPTVISTINFKGGVGKTTSCLNLAAVAYEEGLSVLILDLDPQGSATEFANLDRAGEGPTLFNWLTKSCSLQEVAVKIRGDEREKNERENSGSIFLCPADERLIQIQNILFSKGMRFYLQEALAKETSSFLRRFDFIFLDVPPSLSSLSDNVVLASDLPLLVLSCQFMSLKGLRRFTSMIRRAERAGADPDWYILPTFYRPTEIESSLVWSRVAEVVGTYPDGRLLSPIGRFAAFGQAFQVGKSIFDYDRAHKGAEQFSTAFTEVREATRRGFTQKEGADLQRTPFSSTAS